MRYGVICFLLVCYVMHAPGTTATRRKKRLAAGNLITDRRYPWVVSILKQYTTNSNQGLMLSNWCTGSIIDIYGTVLTAAHCFDETMEFSSKKFTLTRVAVMWKSYQTENEPIGAWVNLSMILRHPRSYSVHKKTQEEDIDVALVLLDEFIQRPIVCSVPTLMPIPLSISGSDSALTVGLVAGFGAQPNINENNIFTDYTYGHLSELDFLYFGKGQLWKNKTIYYNASQQSSSMFFAHPYLIKESIPYNPITKLNYAGLCEGDSGGPYMVDEGGSLHLRGIANSGELRHDECCPCSRYLEENYFMDINYPKTRDWIRGTLMVRYLETGVGVFGGIPRVCTEYHG